jgi:hypothetical protein
MLILIENYDQILLDISGIILKNLKEKIQQKEKQTTN